MSERRRAGAIVLLVAALCAAFLFAVCGGDRELGPDDLAALESGGDGTVFATGQDAFSLPARNLSDDELRRFEIGDGLFEQDWVTAQSGASNAAARDGLGPLFNAVSCSSCHGQDGRGRPPLDVNDATRGLLLQLSLPEQFRDLFAPDSLPGTPIPDPNYGVQLQDQAIAGHAPEGRFVVLYEELEGTYADGESYTLLRPRYLIAELAYGELHPQAQISPRIAPAVFGIGLLEAIAESDLEALADPDDLDGDGVSGRISRVWDIAGETWTVGRLGWKASAPSGLQQAAEAFRLDIGITSSLFPDQPCTDAQPDCAAAPDGGRPEAGDDLLGHVVFYSQTLAAPAARDYEDREHGAELFFAAGCQRCHTPRFTTAEHPIAALSGQTIFPYTDLLLHDLGEGLSDHRAVGSASGSEWRTAPLWGLGLIETVNGRTRFLHDGRARTIAEAILWHGGEAEQSKEAFRTMSKEDREALIAFLESL